MINIFCTHKLAKFLPTEQRTLESYTSDNNWNGQLFYVDGRKCLYFVKKSSLYSLVLIDVIKKDIQNLNRLFLDELKHQLKVDNIYDSKFDHYLEQNFSDIKIFKTDNDQRTLGTLRDTLIHIDAYLSMRPEKLIEAKTHLKTTINDIPIGSRKYRFPKNMMLEELNSYVH